jgi:hypothetical protein
MIYRATSLSSPSHRIVSLRFLRVQQLVKAASGAIDRAPSVAASSVSALRPIETVQKRFSDGFEILRFDRRG